jgi:hypothetical protein
MKKKILIIYCKNYLIYTIILLFCFTESCHPYRQRVVVGLADTFFKDSYTKMELYYYRIWHRSLTVGGVAFHFKPDSTFLFYSCDPGSPHMGKYQVKQDTIFINDCTHSLVPKQFVFLDRNKIIGDIFIKKYNKKCVFICQQDSLSKLKSDPRCNKKTKKNN